MAAKKKARMSIQCARAIDEPIVYALSRPGGEFVYVGMTRNPNGRLACYQTPGGCHNPALAEWLANGDCEVTILHRGEDRLEQVEAQEIADRRAALFNMVGGGEQSWRSRTRKPWQLSTGVHCPSALLMHHLACRGRETGRKRNFGGLKKRVAGMSDDARVRYEASLAMEFEQHPALGKGITKWLDQVTDRLIPALEQARAA